MGLDAFVQRWGRAAALAVWCSGLGTLIMGGLFLLVINDHADQLVLIAAVPLYFTMMGLIGAGAQLPNTAERLPGHRSWNNPHTLDNGTQQKQLEEK